MDIERKVRREILSLTRPQHGGDIWQYGDVEDFSSNINPLGPPVELKQFFLETVDKIQHYPDDSAVQLKEAISNHFDISVDQIIVGGGSVELIRLFSEVFLERGNKVIIPQPTFEEYSFSCRFIGARIIYFPLSEDNSFKINFEELFEKIDRSIKAVFLCNPNNPTSKVETKKKILEFVEECEKREILVFLDEAFIDFVESPNNFSCIQEVENHNNLFIIRSLTKSFAIPGLRVGYGIGSKPIIRYMENARLSWNVNTIAQLVASKLINECYDHLEKAIKAIKPEKNRIFDTLQKTKFYKPIYPDANFFFVRIDGLGINSQEFKKTMLKWKILVRDCTSFGSPCEKYTRFAIKTPEKNDKLIEAMNIILTHIKKPKNGEM